MLVFGDADPDVTWERIIRAGYFTAGQSCTAANRVITADHTYDHVVAKLAARAANTTAG
jgi:acyl-CoA reductase-like NAD-dependent aldehyde dehydrogenase